jgi:hypothetical protein
MVRPYTYSRGQRIYASEYLRALAMVGLFCLIAASCSGGTKDSGSTASGSSAEIIKSPEFRQLLQIMAEERLAADSQPYLALDFSKRRLQIRVNGAIVRDFPITTTADSSTLASFAACFGEGDSPIRRIERVYLFEGAKLINDTVLGIVTETSNAQPQKIQRYRPSRLAITWEGKLTMMVQTSIGGQPMSGSKNFLEATRSFVEQTFGGERIDIQLEPDEAMSLYGICHPGLPTLLVR